MAERYLIRERFWTKLLEYAKQQTKLHSGITPGQYSWIGTGAGKQGLGFNYAIRKNEAQVELYIDKGKDSEDANKQIFDQLVKNKDAVESVFNDSLEWQRLEGKRACRIRKQIKTGGYRDEDRWPEIHEEMVDAMIRLEKSLRPFIEKLNV